jgi:sortase A
LKWLQRLLFAVAAVLLGYCGFVWADGWFFQHRERAEFEKLVHEGASPAGLPAVGRDGLGQDGLIGRIEVPRLEVSVVVIEGTGWAVLRHAAGHIPGTALPGEPGNVGISAHRDTFFRPLRNIRANDEVTVTTLRGEYRYRVVSTKIVDPDDVAVLKAGGGETLTLVTCYPFYFVGAAPQRFIVRAERVPAG